MAASRLCVGISPIAAILGPTATCCGYDSVPGNVAEEGDHVNEARRSDHGSEAREQRTRLSRNFYPSAWRRADFVLVFRRLLPI